MGKVYQANLGLIKPFSDTNIVVRKALVQTGQGEIKVKAAELTAEEVEAILLKLDLLANSWADEAIATMIAEEVESILAAVRMVKDETKEPFMGIQGLGSALDIAWLRPRNVGETNTLNGAGTAGLGLYSGASGGIYNWLQNFIAGTTKAIIPTQTMAEEAAVVHLGAIDPVDIPKCNAITFTLQGVASPTQSLPFNIRKSSGNYSIPFVRFEKPIIVGPEKQQQITLVPNITGDSKVELLSLLITKASLLVA